MLHCNQPYYDVLLLNKVIMPALFVSSLKSIIPSGCLSAAHSWSQLSTQIKVAARPVCDWNGNQGWGGNII